MLHHLRRGFCSCSASLSVRRLPCCMRSVLRCSRVSALLSRSPVALSTFLPTLPYHTLPIPYSNSPCALSLLQPQPQLQLHLAALCILSHVFSAAFAFSLHPPPSEYPPLTRHFILPPCHAVSHPPPVHTLTLERQRIGRNKNPFLSFPPLYRNISLPACDTFLDRLQYFLYSPPHLLNLNLNRTQSCSHTRPTSNRHTPNQESERKVLRQYVFRLAFGFPPWFWVRAYT
ncbi:hypothetical protein CPAR01_01067 [Colletotrichum paranaense]|uniref:Uncharacterized protein n=1 Tax=Colletotrichum paranaense TaxID=1914294 RepID=A0ABQ9T637_9PEZI|nr:uncharacterized protein CPAR01_01067 [Colletotrichum paranaense]KAK1547100.1 hypothetical protein CPAR01_01067 [Colletotrichum paranaense]